MKQRIEQINSSQKQYLDLLKEKTVLEEKIAKIKLTIPEIKTKYENELLKREMKFEQQKTVFEKRIMELSDKIKGYENMIEKLKISISKHRTETLELEEIIFKQEETINELTEKEKHYEEIIYKKNEQMKQNEIYSLELIRIVNELKQRIANISKNNVNNEKTQLTKRIHILNNKLSDNLKKVQTLEQKNKILQGNYLKLSTSINQDIHERHPINLIKYKKTQNTKSADIISKKRNKSTLLKESTDIYSDINNVMNQKQFVIQHSNNLDNKPDPDSYLVSESAIPKVYSSSRGEKEDEFNLLKFTSNDNYHNNITEINDMMKDLLNEFK